MALLVGATATAIPADAAPVAIRPGTVWSDTGGTPVQAHGGGVIKVGSTYYWIGEDRADVTAIEAWAPGAYTPPFRAIACYASTDLTTWTFVGNLLSLQASGDLGPDRVVERPKVLYNAGTGRFVLWMHIDDPTYADARVGVASSSSVCSGYTYHGSFRPLGQESRDMTVFQDTDGQAYLVHAAAQNSQRRIVRLTPDYLGVSTTVAVLGAGEAPAVFVRDGTYVLLSSAATGWRANDNFYATAPSMAGPWTERGDFTPGSPDTWNSQTTFVLPVSGTAGTTYVHLGDRWDDSSRTSFGDSRYVWLPLSVSGTSLSMDYHESWRIDPATGTWDIAGAGAQLFVDDFEDGDANGWSVSSGTWQVTRPDPTSSLEYASSGSGDSMSTAGSPGWTDYSVESYVTQSGDGGVALLGRVQDASRYYQLELKKDDAGSKRWWLWRRDGATWSELAGGPLDYDFAAPGRWYFLRLDMRGSVLTASVSTDAGASYRVLGSAVDTTYPGGRIGVRKHGSGARFDVIRVLSA